MSKYYNSYTEAVSSTHVSKRATICYHCGRPFYYLYNINDTMTTANCPVCDMVNTISPSPYDAIIDVESKPKAMKTSVESENSYTTCPGCYKRVRYNPAMIIAGPNAHITCVYCYKDIPIDPTHMHCPQCGWYSTYNGNDIINDCPHCGDKFSTKAHKSARKGINNDVTTERGSTFKCPTCGADSGHTTVGLTTFCKQCHQTYTTYKHGSVSRFEESSNVSSDMSIKSSRPTSFGRLKLSDNLSKDVETIESILQAHAKSKSNTISANSVEGLPVLNTMSINEVEQLGSGSKVLLITSKRTMTKFKKMLAVITRYKRYIGPPEYMVEIKGLTLAHPTMSLKILKGTSGSGEKTSFSSYTAKSLINALRKRSFYIS